MGGAKRQRKKYARSLKRWDKERITEEKVLMKAYGLKNKRELLKVSSFLRKIKGQAKKLAARTDEQSKSEKELFLKKLSKLNLLSGGAKLEDVLDLGVKNLLERRLQTQVLKMGLAKTVRQARQFIVHGHIMVGDKKVSIPSYMVLRSEEKELKISSLSPFISEEHPERQTKAAKETAK